MRRVLVTGATGFIGTNLIPILIDRGYTVRVALRREQSFDPSVERVVVGDIKASTNWQEALEGVDCVVHSAARVHVLKERDADPLTAFRSVNVEGTRHLGEAAAAAGVRRLIHLSSVKAQADSTGKEPLTDETPARPNSPYGVSKLEAERALALVAARSTLEAVNLRLPMVYGPGVKGNFRSLLDASWRRLPLPFASVQNQRSVLYIGNLADAVVAMIAAPDRLGGTFLIHDGAPVSTPELIRAIGKSLDRNAILLPTPAWILKVAGSLFGRNDQVDRLLGNLAVDDHGLRNTMKWQPSYTTAEGLFRTAGWYKELYGQREPKPSRQ